MIRIAGAGPKPIPQKSLSNQNLADAIRFCIAPEAKIAAERLSLQMADEDGVRAAAQSFHASLPFERISCNINPELPAAWLYTKSNIRLSKLAAQVLVENKFISQDDLSM
jgi:hypothetical protein